MVFHMPYVHIHALHVYVGLFLKKDANFRPHFLNNLSRFSCLHVCGRPRIFEKCLFQGKIVFLGEFRRGFAWILLELDSFCR